HGRAGRALLSPRNWRSPTPTRFPYTTLFRSGFSQPQAQGTSLAVLSLPICIFAAMVYYRYGFVQLPVVGYIAAGFVVGALCGARSEEHTSELQSPYDLVCRRLLE